MHGPFRWSGKWWPGLVPLVVFWAIAAWMNTDPLESDLAARSSAALQDTLLDKTAIAVAGRDPVLGADPVVGAGNVDLEVAAFSALASQVLRAGVQAIDRCVAHELPKPFRFYG